MVAAALSAGLLALAGCEGPESADAAIVQLDAKVPASFVARSGRGSAVTLRTPPGWKEEPTTGQAVLFLRTDVPQSSVSLVVMDAAPGESLDRTMAGLPELLAKEYANFRHVRTDYVIVNDLPAGRITYEASRSGFDGKLMQAFIQRSGKHYIFTYTANPDRFDAEYPVVEQVLASLVVK